MSINNIATHHSSMENQSKLSRTLVKKISGNMGAQPSGTDTQPCSTEN